MSASAILNAAMTEAELQRTITDACDAMGLLWYHPPDPRKCANCGHLNKLQHKAGFPDLVIVKPPDVYFWELKTQRGRLSVEQDTWMDALISCSAVKNVGIIKPDLLNAAVQIITQGRGQFNGFVTQ